MKKFFLFGLFGAATLFLCASCQDGGGGGDTPVPPKPIVLTTRGAEKVAADNGFAFDFFRQAIATADDKTTKTTSSSRP